MIIIFSNAEINRKAKEALLATREQQVFSLEDLSGHAQNPLDIDVEDKTLTIVELSANGNLQKLYAPTILAKRLHFLGFLNHIDRIQLLISDVIPEKSLLEFATALSFGIIMKNPQTNIAIQVPAEVTHCSLIEPPDDGNEDWKLYQIAQSEIAHPASRDGAFAYYKDQMEMVYTGSIEAVLENPAHIISAEKVRNTYSEYPISDESGIDLKL